MLSIALIGHDEGGKSTIANHIRQKYPCLKPYTIAFANTLKNDLASLDLPVWKKPYSPQLRNLVRLYGETMLQVHGDLHWVDATFSYLDQYIPVGTQLVIFDDMRHIHEYNEWRARYPNRLAIVLPNLSKVKPEDMEHRSVKDVVQLIEWAINGKLDDAVVINNTFTANGLGAGVKAAIKEAMHGLLNSQTPDYL